MELFHKNKIKTHGPGDEDITNGMESWLCTVETTINLEKRLAQSAVGITTEAVTVGMTSSVRPVIRRVIQQRSAPKHFDANIATTEDILHTSVSILNKIGSSGHVDGLQ